MWLIAELTFHEGFLWAVLWATKDHCMWNISVASPDFTIQVSTLSKETRWKIETLETEKKAQLFLTSMNWVSTGWNPKYYMRCRICSTQNLLFNSCCFSFLLKLLICFIITSESRHMKAIHPPALLSLKVSCLLGTFTLLSAAFLLLLLHRIQRKVHKFPLLISEWFQR